MSMIMEHPSLALASALLIAGATSVLAAGSEADFKAAYAAAEAANKEAGALRNQWTVTAAALAAAKKAADSRRLRPGGGVVEGSRSAGQSFDLPGHKRKRSLESARDTLSLEHDPEKWNRFSEKIMFRFSNRRRGDIA